MICNICEKESVCKLIDGSDVVKCAEFLSINPNDYTKDAGMTNKETIKLIKSIQHEFFISDIGCEALDKGIEAIKALDQIRAEIEQWHKEGTNWSDIRLMKIEDIFDKYKAESEE